MTEKREWTVFFSSVFFVLGFSVIFSLVGVLLQSILAASAGPIQVWLGRIGGVVILLFGLSLVGLIRLPFLDKGHTLQVKRKFRSRYLTSFVFGAAFAVGWTPCVGAILGAVLALAVTQPHIAFFLLLSYSLGLGLPFLVVGLFLNQTKHLITRFERTLRYLNYIFGSILIALGVLVFTNQLSRIANLAFASNLLIALNVSSGGSASTLSLTVAFVAGLFSFLSPCVLPLIPAYLSYLATTVMNE